MHARPCYAAVQSQQERQQVESMLGVFSQSTEYIVHLKVRGGLYLHTGLVLWAVAVCIGSPGPQLAS